ncbi:MAG: Ni/Fe hydrogenase subunit alpha, partial [Gammaproteobacteria bacterium]
CALPDLYRVPRRRELEALRADLEWGVAAAEDTVRWAAGLTFPDFTQPYEFVALSHPDEYPFNEGRLVSSAGLDIPIAAFDDHFEEIHVAHSTSLHARLRARGNYFVGPLARFNLDFARLSPRVQAAARAAGLGDGCRNPFQSIVVRALEVLHAYEEALAIIDAYVEPDRPAVDYAVRAGTGHGCTEAPRGICYHRYTVDAAGLITDAVIVPPTSQNQPTIESDLRHFVAAHLDEDDARLQWLCEQAIRNYDPCISCPCHFLDLTVERR